jgi:hypothetical protein
MERPLFDKSTSNTILNQVHEGMQVFDSTGQELGSVRQVFLGEVSDTMENQGSGPATVSTPDTRDESLIDNLAEALSAEHPLPDEVRGRLLREGFIRIDTRGLFASDRFVLPDQIESVSADRVQLRLTKDELIKD